MFAGIFSNDTLTNPNKNKIYIINLQNADEPGSHWVLLYNGYYFDSYGTVPTTNIAPYVKNYNTADFQGLNNSSCGYYCIFVANNIIAGVFPTTGLIPNSSRENEKVLEAFFA
jgi:hypothetical protein